MTRYWCVHFWVTWEPISRVNKQGRESVANGNLLSRRAEGCLLHPRHKVVCYHAVRCSSGSFGRGVTEILSGKHNAGDQLKLPTRHTYAISQLADTVGMFRKVVALIRKCLADTVSSRGRGGGELLLYN